MEHKQGFACERSFSAPSKYSPNACKIFSERDWHRAHCCGFKCGMFEPKLCVWVHLCPFLLCCAESLLKGGTCGDVLGLGEGHRGAFEVVHINWGRKSCK
jgi:hypothetical protein